MTPRQAYEKLKERFERIALLRSCQWVLKWELATGNTPPRGAELRGQQLSTLAVTAHELLVAEQTGDWMELAESDGDNLDPWDAANLAEMRRQYLHQAALDPALVRRFSEASSNCELVWEKVRHTGDFTATRPLLEEIVRLRREIAGAKGNALGMAPYDALMDEFAPGVSGALVDPLFDELAEYLPGLLEKALERQHARPEPLPLKGPFALEKQQAVARKLAEAIGFDFEAGRLDVSAHPFSGGQPEDLRMTARYNEDDFLVALQNVTHETGHAIYNCATPLKWRRQPVGQAAGMLVHESQSLIIEMQAVRSRDFIAFAAPLFREVFGQDGPEMDEENIYRLQTRVGRTLIRVTADEITYPLHIILRTRLEKVLLSGDLAVADLPVAWNDAMEELLGITPPDNAKGCMQDIHWYHGDFGYFPSYTLGALGAAQLFQAALKAEPEIPGALRQGNFKPLTGWLNDNIHSHGRYYSRSSKIIERATGKPLTADDFRAHLERRYLEA